MLRNSVRRLGRHRLLSGRPPPLVLRTTLGRPARLQAALCLGSRRDLPCVHSTQFAALYENPGPTDLSSACRSLGLHRVLTPYLAALCSRTRLYLAPYGRCA